MDAALLQEAETLFGAAEARQMQHASEGDVTAPPPHEEAAVRPDETSAATAAPIVRLHMSARQQRRLWRHVATVEDFWHSLREIEPGSIARLAQLAGERGWEIIFLTKRPRTAGATAQVQSQRWLESKGFPLPSVYVVQRSRGLIASALSLDVVVDDRPENCFDVVADSEAKPILVWRGSRTKLPQAAHRLGVAVVPSVVECLELLVAVDSSAAADTSILSRFKRLLGVE